jgi:hypothetical protein
MKTVRKAGAMNMQWTPETLFLFTYIASAITSLGIELLDESKELSPKLVLGTVIVYGALGSAMGWFAYEYLGGRQSPGKVIVAGLAVGVRAIKVDTVRQALRRLILNGKTDANNK